MNAATMKAEVIKLEPRRLVPSNSLPTYHWPSANNLDPVISLDAFFLDWALRTGTNKNTPINEMIASGIGTIAQFRRGVRQHVLPVYANRVQRHSVIYDEKDAGKKIGKRVSYLYRALYRWSDLARFAMQELESQKQLLLMHLK